MDAPKELFDHDTRWRIEQGQYNKDTNEVKLKIFDKGQHEERRFPRNWFESSDESTLENNQQKQDNIFNITFHGGRFTSDDQKWMNWSNY